MQLVVKTLKGLSVSILLSIACSSANAYQTYEKLWMSNVLTGSLAVDQPYKYYLQTDLRFIDSPYIFNQFLLLGGLGYQFTPAILVFGGVGRVFDKTADGSTIKENRLWQQLNWSLINFSHYMLNSRTRLEEVKNLDQSQLLYRIRQRFWLRVPIKRWDSYYISCYDEIFLHFNHPEWSSPYVFSQNRAFIGIAKRFSPQTILDIGYLNQYIHSTQNQINHVLLFSFTINYA